jgi:hypothetical protein
MPTTATGKRREASPSLPQRERYREMTEEVEALTTGPIHWFENWPTGGVPRTGAVVYTIWDREGRFIYVGMSGRGYQGVTRPGSSGPWGASAAMQADAEAATSSAST